MMRMRILSTLKAKWFWYSVLCVACWGAWAILEKIASNEIPARTVQFIFAVGALPVALVLLAVRHFRLEKNSRGVFYSLAIGVLAGIGNAALAAAYQTQGNTSVITAGTAMYPMLTVVLAVWVLGERLTRLHIIGLCFAAASFVIFSL